MPSPTEADRIGVGQALALGVLHGPAELMPISSSGHMALVPWLLRWNYAEADPDVRKAFEVALHAGTAVALLIALRGEVIETVTSASPRLVGQLALSSLPAAVVGYTLEGPIERRLGTPATIAAGLMLGSAAMAWSDRRPRTRSVAESGWADAWWLGIAQACALMPGVSRNGATLTAGRLRRFRRPDANRLSRHVALPVIGGATGLKLVRLLARGLPAGAAVPFAIGAGASFVSTLASARLIGQVERDRSLAPYVAYRMALAGLVLARLSRRDGRR